MRVVLDTNILISACWTPAGLEHQVVRLALQGHIMPCTSPAVWGEYRDVLSRKKFSSRAERIQKMLADLENRALLFCPAHYVSLASDEDDNRFLECAEAAGAEFLITGNLRDFPASWKGTRVVHAREFLNCWLEDRYVLQEDG